MKYTYTIIAGSPKKPCGVVGSYPTRKQALAAWPKYAAYIRRNKVKDK